MVPKQKISGENVVADLFIKKMPSVVKQLISREAFDNRRSVNQEAIALLEEALVHRVESTGRDRKKVEAMFQRFAEARHDPSA